MTTQAPTVTANEVIDLPEATVILDHSQPVNFEREAMPLLRPLLMDFIRAEAAADTRTDAELEQTATFGVPGDLCNDQAHVALAKLRARKGTLAEMHPALVERAAATLAERYEPELATRVAA